MSPQERGLSSDTIQRVRETSLLLEGKQRPVDYSTIINGNRVILLGENHDNSPIRLHLAKHIDDFKAAGVTHYVIEADESINILLHQLNSGKRVDLSSVYLGPGRAGHYEEVVRAMAESGIEVVAIDWQEFPYSDHNRRESKLTGNIREIIGRNPSAKILALLGLFHTFRHKRFDRIKPVARRLIRTEVPIVSVAYAGGIDGNPPQILTESARAIGAGNKEFMIDLRALPSSQGIEYVGNSDWIVHLPQRPYSDIDLI